MIIHFVCRGNTYRSRLAEAYFNSLAIPGWTAISSGIEATHNLNGDITPYARDILREEGLTQFGKQKWTQTTKENLESADIVVFMNTDVFEDSSTMIPTHIEKHIVWSVEDVDVTPVEKRDMSVLTHAAYNKIVSEIDNLVHVVGLTTPPSED